MPYSTNIAFPDVRLIMIMSETLDERSKEKGSIPMDHRNSLDIDSDWQGNVTDCVTKDTARIYDLHPV